MLPIMQSLGITLTTEKEHIVSLITIPHRASARRLLSSFVTLLTLAALLFGASIVLGQAATQEAEPTEVTVIHAQGETVVPFKPQTVLVFDLGTLDMLDSLGVTVTGVPKSNLPGALERFADDEYLDIGTLFEPDYEAVAAADADLIIVGTRAAAVYSELSAIAPTIDLSPDPSDFLAGQEANARIIGQIFGLEDEIEEQLTAIEEKVAEVQELTAEAGTALIVMTSGGEVNAYGIGSRFGWIHDVLGFTPAIEDIEAATHGEAISFEFILEANPDWLLVLDRDAAVGETGSEAAAQILDNELVAQTTAWSNDQVIYLDPVDWYMIAGGLPALERMVDAIGTPLAGVVE